MWRLITFWLTAALLSGCEMHQSQSGPRGPDSVMKWDAHPYSFVESDYVDYRSKGSGAIDGKAYLSSEKQPVIYQHDNPIYLIPKSAYTNHWFQEFVLKGGECETDLESVENPDVPFFRDSRDCILPFVMTLDKRLNPYLRIAKAGIDGTFTFTDLPSGHYLLATFIVWWDGSRSQGGIAHAQVSLEPSERVRGISVTRVLR
jgi:hypothetical protein